MSRLAVFAGPSLPVADRIQVANVTYLPPACRHDVRDASERYDAILLIDGVFHHDLAVSTKEVYGAAKHATVFGAASIGALRAAENWRYGVRPLGIVARWYIEAVIDGDDEVAVLMGRTDHRALSVPLVNVRYLCRLCVRRGLLHSDVTSEIISRARQIFYPERTWDDVLLLVPGDVREAVATIARHEGDVKRLDAVFALRSVLRRLRLSSRGARPFTRVV